jgi:hypothetical protein
MDVGWSKARLAAASCQRRAYDLDGQWTGRVLVALKLTFATRDNLSQRWGQAREVPDIQIVQ